MRQKTNTPSQPVKLSEKEEVVFVVEFLHEIDDYDSLFLPIGIFSSEAKANEAVDILLTKPGFKNYTRDNFSIGPNLVDLIYWHSGFSTTKH